MNDSIKRLVEMGEERMANRETDGMRGRAMYETFACENFPALISALRERDEARRKAISECICAIKTNTVLPMPISTRLWDERHKAINECVNILSRVAEGREGGDDASAENARLKR